LSYVKKLSELVKEKKAKICVMGLGYVGLPTALHFAASGYRVYGFDVDKKKINILNDNKLPFYDAGLDNTFEKAQKSGNITFHNKPDCIKECDFVLVIVPTPVNAQKVPELKYIISAGDFIAQNLRENQIIVLESTVYPGVTEEVLGKTIEQKTNKKAGEDFHLAYVPERYNPGDIKHTMSKIVRVIGANSPKIAEILKELYSTISELENGIFLVRDTKTAEASKVIENTQRDLNIALMNEIALICERLGIDSIEVIEAAATKWNFIKYYPGAGVGGHCLPHDPYYLTSKAKELGYNPEIILAGRRLNDWMPYHMTDLIQEGLNKIEKSVKGSKIIILGASYKENTGDLRSAPSEIVVKKLLQKGAEIILIDPYVIGVEEVWGCKLYKSLKEAPIQNADAIALMTFHDIFTDDLLLNIRKQLNEKVVLIDGRRKIDSVKISKDYFLIQLGSGIKHF